MKGAVLSWVTNLLLFFIFIYARGELPLLLRLINIRGATPFVFVVWPLVSLPGVYLFFAIGWLFYNASK